jgi:competence protein ComEC
MWILASSCAFIAGVGIAATHNPAWLLAFGPTIAFVSLLIRRSIASIALLAAISLFFVSVGVVRYGDSVAPTTVTLVSELNGCGTVRLQAVVADEPEPGGRYTRVLLDHIMLEGGDSLEQRAGKVLVTSADPRPLHYGDIVRFHGALETPESIGDFDYAAYLAQSGVYATAFCADLEVLQSGAPHSVRGRLLALNAMMAQALSSVLPEPQASLAQSLLLGRRAGLSRETADAFVRTGTAHLLAISGLHLGILTAMVLTLLLAVLGRRHYLYVWLGILAVWTYALFTGMRPPVVRASIMASTFLMAELAGRQKHAPTALALAAAIMVAFEPRILWSTSFQLSVLAMGGLTVLFPPLRSSLMSFLGVAASRLGRRPVGGEVAIDIVAATMAATLATWPVCAGAFGQLSLVGIPVSLLTLPVLPVVLGASALAGTVALVAPAVAAPLGWVAWPFLTHIIAVVQSFSRLSWAVVETGAMSVWLSAGYYSVLCAIPVLSQRLRRKDLDDHARTQPRSEDDGSPRWLLWALPPLLLATAVVWAAVVAAPDGRLHVIVSDIGQGDSILVQSPTGRTLLVDGGPDGAISCAAIDRHMPFWDRSIDVVVATHAHADHVGGLLLAVERYRMGAVLEPASSPSPSLKWDEWHSRLADAGLTATRVSDGYYVDLGDGVRLDVLNPTTSPLSGTSDDDDNNGVVLRLAYGDVSFLLGADIRLEAERRLVHDHASELGATVLKVAHHGSDSSSTEQLLAAVGPRVAVISAGADNPYGHPHGTTLERLSMCGADVLTTAIHGTVELVTDGRELWLSTG